MKYTSCTMLVQDLLVAKRDLRLSKEIKKLGRHDGLIIDEMGYVQQSREEMEVLFTLLAERYERGSVLLTSNLPFSKWEGSSKIDDHGGSHRQAGASLGHRGTEHPQLSNGGGEEESGPTRKAMKPTDGDRRPLLLAGPPLRPFGATLQACQQQHHLSMERRQRRSNNYR